MSNPSLDWERIGDKFYTKLGIYSMLWDTLDLSKYYVVAAPFGGPIAVIKHVNKLVPAHSSTKPILTIYTSSGKMIHQINWDKGVIVQMGWLNDERICCVVEQGSAYLYDLQGKHHVVALGDDASQFGVMQAAITRKGEIVFLTGNLKFYILSDIHDAKLKLMPSLGLDNIPDSWTVISGDVTTSGHIEILIAWQNTIYQVDMLSSRDQVNVCKIRG